MKDSTIKWTKLMYIVDRQDSDYLNKTVTKIKNDTSFQGTKNI